MLLGADAYIISNPRVKFVFTKLVCRKKIVTGNIFKMNYCYIFIFLIYGVKVTNKSLDRKQNRTFLVLHYELFNSVCEYPCSYFLSNGYCRGSGREDKVNRVSRNNIKQGSRAPQVEEDPAWECQKCST